MTCKILIVDDDVQYCNILGRVLTLEGFSIFKCYDLRSSSAILKKQNIDVVLLDAMLPDGNGALFTKELKTHYPQMKTIILTGHPDIKTCVNSIKNGAADYVVKGQDIREIIDLLKNQINTYTTTSINHGKDDRRIETIFGFNNIIGDSEIIRDALDLAKKVAATDTTVLLLGETGTGKELFAKAIHQSSTRKNAQFVAVNCSSFSHELLESELFGYRSGAFTGAIKDKRGLLEEADEGTLFLDEIGEVEKELQSRLLRVLESGEFIKIGDNKVNKVNIRLISATSRDLYAEITQGNFREDLFYRLNIFSIHLPALRDRKEDILLLTEYYVKLFSKKLGKHITGITKEFERFLLNYHWKGNIRELKNIIERSVILAEGSILTENSLPFEILSFQFKNSRANYSPFDLNLFERLHIQKVLINAKWNKSEAAKLLNISLSTLYRKIEDYMLAPEDHN